MLTTTENITDITRITPIPLSDVSLQVPRSAPLTEINVSTVFHGIEAALESNFALSINTSASNELEAEMKETPKLTVKTSVDRGTFIRKISVSASVEVNGESINGKSYRDAVISKIVKWTNDEYIIVFQTADERKLIVLPVQNGYRFELGDDFEDGETIDVSWDITSASPPISI